VTWRARSASDENDDWVFWYVTKDSPKDYNDTHEAYKLATGQDFPPAPPFMPKPFAIHMANKLNEGALLTPQSNPSGRANQHKG